MHKLGAWLLKGLLRLLGLLPLRVHYALGRFMAWLFAHTLAMRHAEPAYDEDRCDITQIRLD